MLTSRVYSIIFNSDIIIPTMLVLDPSLVSIICSSFSIGKPGILGCPFTHHDSAQSKYHSFRSPSVFRAEFHGIGFPDHFPRLWLVRSLANKFAAKTPYLQARWTLSVALPFHGSVPLEAKTATTFRLSKKDEIFTTYKVAPYQLQIGL